VTPSNRSISAANDSRASAPLGRATSTRSPSSRARSAPAFHSVVVPMPASPPSTGARLETPATRKACNTPSYGSRPTTPNKCRTGPFLHVFHSLSKLHSQHTCLPHHLPQAIARRSKLNSAARAAQAESAIPRHLLFSIKPQSAHGALAGSTPTDRPEQNSGRGRLKLPPLRSGGGMARMLDVAAFNVERQSTGPRCQQGTGENFDRSSSLRDAATLLRFVRRGHDFAVAA
jgi:hypothetical protein